MTYCLALGLDAGFVCVSDSRTNAGVDNVRTYSKLHRFELPGERVFVLLSAGNLATTQAVVGRLKRDLETEGGLHAVAHISEAAARVGELSVEAQQGGREGQEGGAAFQAAFILAGQIAGDDPGVFMIYPQGNYIATTAETPYLQLGEVKYGKPILDRLAAVDMPLTAAARCALVSMDAAMRSNLSVGPPIELVIYERDSMETGRYLKFDQDSPYWRTLQRGWSENLRGAFERLPRFDWE